MTVTLSNQSECNRVLAVWTRSTKSKADIKEGARREQDLRIFYSYSYMAQRRKRLGKIVIPEKLVSCLIFFRHDVPIVKKLPCIWCLKYSSQCYRPKPWGEQPSATTAYFLTQISSGSWLNAPPKIGVWKWVFSPFLAPSSFLFSCVILTLQTKF